MNVSGDNCISVTSMKLPVNVSVTLKHFNVLFYYAQQKVLVVNPVEIIVNKKYVKREMKNYKQTGSFRLQHQLERRITSANIMCDARFHLYTSITHHLSRLNCLEMNSMKQDSYRVKYW